MSDHLAILEEEFEVLEAIFPDEFEKTDDNGVRIQVEPEEEMSTPLTLTLVFAYPPTYPDVIPEMHFETIDEDDLGALREGEEEEVLAQLRAVADESLGMAMTFTLATAAREALSSILAARLVKEQEEDDARTRAYEEEEARKTRGTPLTRDRYATWRDAFRAEMARKRAKEEEDRVRALPSKEREDWRRRRDRLSGRQLFETSKVSATSDAALYEDGEAVDLSKFSREERDRERWGDGDDEPPAGVDLADSDDE